ncbi:hypothetical protein HMPREF1205_01993 [Bacteroides fragilis HMW 616]|nr:hypothetical protein HMPREF1205_01993 [Bacteroides fragilis HMW 616]
MDYDEQYEGGTNKTHPYFLLCYPHKIKGEIHIPPLINQNYNLRVSYVTTGSLTRLSQNK